MTTEPEPLKPCPFCGGEAAMTTALGEYWVRCATGCCHSMHATQSAASAEWNRRAPTDADRGRRLVRALFPARQAVVDAANAGGVNGTWEADAHFDRCETALADWEAETATPDARLRHALDLALSVINTMPRRSVEVTHVVGVCEAALREWSEATSSPSDARLREMGRGSVEFLEAIDANQGDEGCEEANAAYVREMKSYAAWRKVVKG